jgi:hypothetical protein
MEQLPASFARVVFKAQLRPQCLITKRRMRKRWRQAQRLQCGGHESWLQKAKENRFADRRHINKPFRTLGKHWPTQHRICSIFHAFILVAPRTPKYLAVAGACYAISAGVLQFLALS